jgi:hypothetical protein
LTPEITVTMPSGPMFLYASYKVPYFAAKRLRVLDSQLDDIIIVP